jgi:hypothetical protein
MGGRPAPTPPSIRRIVAKELIMSFVFVRPSALVLALSMLAAPAFAATIPMPAGSRSWILVSGSDCDDDGFNVNNDRAHCTGVVSQLMAAGDIGHGVLGPTYAIVADATIGPEFLRGSIAATGGFSTTFMDLSVIDTYTLHSPTLPPGTPVSVTVRFRAEADLIPRPVATAYGGGVVAIRIGDAFNPNPIVVPENTRVLGNLGPTASAQAVHIAPLFSPAVIPIDIEATNTFTAFIGVPFDRAFYLGARPGGSEIDFHNTGTIRFDLPQDVTITSTGGFGSIVPVAPTTWSGIKSRVR